METRREASAVTQRSLTTMFVERVHDGRGWVAAKARWKTLCAGFLFLVAPVTMGAIAGRSGMDSKVRITPLQTGS